MAVLEARGLVGRAVYWQRDRQVVLSDLDHFPEFDRDCRAAAAATPLAAELAFGMPHTPTPPVTIPLPSGRRVRVRGCIWMGGRAAAGLPEGVREAPPNDKPRDS